MWTIWFDNTNIYLWYTGNNKLYIALAVKWRENGNHIVSINNSGLKNWLVTKYSKVLWIIYWFQTLNRYIINSHRIYKSIIIAWYKATKFIDHRNGRPRSICKRNRAFQVANKQNPCQKKKQSKFWRKERVTLLAFANLRRRVICRRYRNWVLTS